MALIYETTMSPTKLEMLAEWLPGQFWFEGDASQLASVGAYRFDDPDGEVGMEGHLLTAGDDVVYHVPLTYRGAALDGGEEFLLSTTEHGVLGTRWVYDAMGDPVYRAVLATTIAQGGNEAEEFIALDDGGTRPRDIFTKLRGSGEPDGQVPELWAAKVFNEDGLTHAQTGFASLTIKRIATREGTGPQGAQVLQATWPGHHSETVIAILHTN